MPSAKKKELNLAKSVGELNKMAQIQDKIGKNANPKPWINSAEKVYKKAVDDDLMGDEENAFVFYMRFFNIMQEVTKTAKYQADKKYYSSIIGRTALNKAIDRAEKLSESLRERYKKLEEETKAAAIENERKAKEKDKNEKANTKNVSNTLQDIDDLLNGKKTSSQTSADVYKKLHVNHSSILSPSDKNSDEKDLFSQPPIKSTTSPTIDPVALYQLLNNDQNDVLVLDTRSKKDYESSRINYSCCINIPDDLLKTSVMVGSIERKLPKSTWDQWIERGRKGHIVILNLNTKFTDIKPESKIQCLKDAIYLYDTSITLKSEPLFLDGGYEAWLWHYPSLVTNPKLPEQIVPSQNKAQFSLDSISYPELPTLPEPARPKPQSNGTTNGPAQTKLNSPSNSQPSPTGANRPAGTIPQQQGGQNATVPASISQNVPSAVKAINPATLPNNDSLPRPQNAQNLAPKVSVTQQFPNNTTQQQQLPSQGITRTPHQPSPNTTPNADVSKVVPNNNDVIRLGPNSPQGLSSPHQPGLVPAPVTPNHGLQPANQNSPRQAIPNMPNAPQTKGNGQAAPTSNVSQTVTSLPNNQSQAGTSLLQNQPQNATSHPMVPPVAPQTSSNKMTSKNSPVGGPPTPQSQIPSTVTSPQQPPQHPSGVVAPQPSYIVNGQSNPTPRPQILPSTISPTHPQPSMAQQLRPNVSGILPKMTARNPSTQPNISGSTTHAPQSLATSTPIPPSTTHVPQSQASIQRPTSIPKVPQTFTSSRTGMTHGLPPGWERVLDRKTGRYYFLDHNTKTTHWNPPESLTQTMNQSIMGHNTPTAKEAEPKKPSLKRSLSSPNLAKIDAEETKLSAPKGTTSRPTVNRRTKPLTESQLANLAPNHGGHGKALTGLRNLGNSCYMNSVLQCLIATAPLAQYILNSYYLDDINKTNPLGTGGRIAEELAVLTRVAHSGNYRSVSPYEFKRTIGRFAPEFGGTKQQDSQEFLLVLLDQFHEDTNRVLKKAYIEEKSNDGLPDSAAARLAWDNHKKRNQSIIVELLQGQFKSTLTCSVCSKQSVTFDAFMSLTLPIPTNASCQIEDCIRLFTTREKVSRDNKWFCPRCKQHREAWKTMEIWKLPPILIVHFNRFKRDFDGSWLEKRQTNVHFPSTNLDLSKFVLGPNKSLRYNLYGVSNHYGSMQSGHYTAFCKNIYDRKWHKFDDSDVTSMSESSVKSSAAYILCYTSMEFTKP